MENDLEKGKPLEAFIKIPNILWAFANKLKQLGAYFDID